jgi:sec-independent protein translocase protein TatC
VAYVVLAFASMLVAPTADPFTMLVIMVPLVVLYEISILLCVLMARQRQKAEGLEDAEEEDEEKDDSIV